MTRRALTCPLALVMLLAAALAGCGSNFIPRGSGYSGDADTYESTPWSPKTVELVDTRIDQVIWSVDIPVGQKLTIAFKGDNSGDRDADMPDVMSWVVQPIRRHSWKGRQKMLVPGPSARLVVMSLRDAPEAGPSDDDIAMDTPPALEPDAEPAGNETPETDENGTPVEESSEG